LYDRCYQSGNSETFFKVVGNVYLGKADAANAHYHHAHTPATIVERYISINEIERRKAALEFDWMYSFVINTLRPAALLFDEDLCSTFIPQLDIATD
jgi:hypothetical protein